MASGKVVFIGAYVPREVKESLQRRARAEYRTLSQELTRILTEAIYGQDLPPGHIERRGLDSTPHRRQDDPMVRRRHDDLPAQR